MIDWTTVLAAVLAALITSGLAIGAASISRRSKEKQQQARADIQLAVRARETYEAILHAREEEIARVQQEAHQARTRARAAEARAEVLESTAASLRRALARALEELASRGIAPPTDMYIPPAPEG